VGLYLVKIGWIRSAEQEEDIFTQVCLPGRLIANVFAHKMNYPIGRQESLGAKPFQ